MRTIIKARIAAHVPWVNARQTEIASIRLDIEGGYHGRSQSIIEIEPIGRRLRVAMHAAPPCSAFILV